MLDRYLGLLIMFFYANGFRVGLRFQFNSISLNFANSRWVYYNPKKIPKNRIMKVMLRKPLDLIATKFDHKITWSSGGRTTLANARGLCINCHDLVTHESRLKEVDQKRKQGKKSGIPFALPKFI